MNKDKIVSLHKKQLTTTSEIIAAKCGLQHKNTLALIRKYIDKFQRHGILAFQTRVNKHGEPTEYAILNEAQATYLITLFRNTDYALGLN
jgi:phage regulator Rha-like protein